MSKKTKTIDSKIEREMEIKLYLIVIYKTLYLVDGKNGIKYKKKTLFYGFTFKLLSNLTCLKE